MTRSCGMITNCKTASGALLGIDLSRDGVLRNKAAVLPLSRGATAVPILPLRVSIASQTSIRASLLAIRRLKGSALERRASHDRAEMPMFPVSVFSRSFLFRLVRFGLTECDLDNGAGACNLSGVLGPGKRKRPKTGQEGGRPAGGRFS